jgi:hypothetical protein
MPDVARSETPRYCSEGGHSSWICSSQEKARVMGKEDARRVKASITDARGMLSWNSKVLASVSPALTTPGRSRDLGHHTTVPFCVPNIGEIGDRQWPWDRANYAGCKLTTSSTPLDEHVKSWAPLLPSVGGNSY